MDFMYMLAAAGATWIPGEVSAWLRPTIQIIMAIIGLGLIVIVMMQKSSTDNIGAIGGQETDTYAGKNKSKSKDSILKKWTIIAGAIILVLSVLFFITYR